MILSGEETESVYANAIKQPEWCELSGDHGATGAAHGQALAECSPPQPGTQHLWWLAPCAPDEEVMQLVHSCGLPKELSYLKAAAVGCEELADDVLVLHQLKSSLGAI
eukprot:Em0018g848a